MLIQPPNAGLVLPNVRREKRLWNDDVQNTPSIGCERCFDKATCGGLSVNKALWNCLDLCCGKPDECDKVCRNRPDAFARSVREIDGFQLETVPRAPVLPKPTFDSLVPVLYHRGKRLTPFQAATVCLPLYDVIAKHDGTERYESTAELAEGFGVAENAAFILTGTDIDPPLERWWSLSGKRREIIRKLRRLHISLVTTPNFSMFTDRPRWDDMHSMKRIAVVHEEFLTEGMPAALHVNARTEKDWDRWKRYIADRPEITHIAFEFATGAGWATRTAWHVEQLTQLARAVGRPLHLVMRGGSKVLAQLAAEFDECTFLETNVFMKTEHRQRAFLLPNGKIKWHRSPTKENEPVDALLNENWSVMTAYYARLLEKNAESQAA